MVGVKVCAGFAAFFLVEMTFAGQGAWADQRELSVTEVLQLVEKNSPELSASKFRETAAEILHRRRRHGHDQIVHRAMREQRTVRPRVAVTANGKFIEAESFPSHTGIIKADTPQMMDSFDGTALIPADATELAVRLAGEQFSPQLRIAIPKAGDKAQTASMVMGLRTKE